ncbi:MAG: PilN domain-containing protein, partial [Candidatus Omnitrophica bacterium]|nr:PilN domain-containing protein [Candidatus Omnitrophota bacterium]
SKQVPYTNEEVIWGYKILKTYESGYSEVMVAIPRYKVISERIKWLFESGFDVEGFSLSSECLYNWYCQNYLDPEARYNNTDMVVDISSDHTEFLVISQGRIVFSKAILLGANSIQAADGYDKWQEEFMADLRDTLEIYRSEGKRKEIDSIFLTGAQNIDSDKLQNRINKGLGIDVRREDALKNIKFLKGTTQLPEKELIRSTSITALVGAGIKTRSLDINFIPRAIKISKGLGQRKSDLTTIGILLMGIVTLITVLPGAKIYKRISYLNELKQEDIEMRKGVEEIERLRMKIRLVEERLGAGDSILNVIDELYRVTPKELYNKSLEIDEERNIVIKGRASAMSEIFNFITTLEESERIANVKTSFTATKEDKEGNYAEFEISCKYQALKD